MHDSRPERSRNPTVLTRSSSPSSTEQTFARAASSSATVTTRKTAASDNGASILCASIGTLSQLFPVVSGISAIYANVSSSQSNMRAKARRLAPTSQWKPAPSAVVKRIRVSGQFRWS